MKIFFSPAHIAHAPAYEFFRGERVACFEAPARAEFIRHALLESGRVLLEPTTDSSAVLAQVHTARYVNFLTTSWDQWLALDAANAGRQPFPSVWPVRTLRSDVVPTNFIAQLGLYSMDNGTPLSSGSWGVAKAGADAAASAAAALQAGERSSFCATRPPGHHAGADFMGGYCFLNNAAVAAQALINNGCKRVAVLDVDYHHGNGTQSIFYERSDVLFISLHGDPCTEYPFYLGHADEPGSGPGHGFNLNLPLAAGCTAAQWFAALDVACTRLQRHSADALVVSLGLDTFADDPISTFALLASDFSKLGERLKRLGLPTIFILEGGYAAAELGSNAVKVLDAFED